MKIIIIGSGLGGLTAALLLVSRGYEVEVFEKNSIPGGKAGYFEQEGFTFDTGPSVLTMPFVIEKLFQKINVPIAEYLEFQRLDIITKYFYEDGTVINAYSDIEKFANEVERKTEDDSYSVKSFLGYTKRIYESAGKHFLFNNIKELRVLKQFKVSLFLLKFFLFDFHKSMSHVISKYFKSEKLRMLFNRYATYNGSNPFKAPAILNVIAHVENNLGAFVLKGGMRKLPEVLFNIAQNKGVKFYFDSKVEEIITRNKKAIGVKIDNKEINGDIVISNVDSSYTNETLLNLKNLNKKEVSTSAIIFYWGVKQDYISRHPLETHNIFFSNNQRKEFDELFKYKRVLSDPPVYLYISSKFNSGDAPKGCENWFVMINTPASGSRLSDLEINRIRNVIQHTLIDRLGFDISKYIVTEKVTTPYEIQESTGSFHGALYGYSSNSYLSAFFRENLQSKKYANLFYCGGSTHPGGGVPLVILSGILVVEKVEKYCRKS